MIWIAVRLVSGDEDYPESMEWVDHSSISCHSKEDCQKNVDQMDRWCPTSAKKNPVIRIGQFDVVEIKGDES